MWQSDRMAVMIKIGEKVEMGEMAKMAEAMKRAETNSRMAKLAEWHEW